MQLTDNESEHACDITNENIIAVIDDLPLWSAPFESDSFDVIVSNNGINNVDDDRKAMTEIARVAKSDAQLVITVNLPVTFAELD